MASWPKVLFIDLDNTLYDYDGAAAQALSALATALHRRFGLDVDEVMRQYRSIREQIPVETAATATELRRRRIRRLLDLWPATAAVDETEFIELLGNSLLEAIRWHAGADAVLRRFAARVPVVIVTEAYEDVARAIALRLGIDDGSCRLLATYAHKVSKRDGGAYRLALDWVRAAPADCLMVGDNWTLDVMGASLAGIPQIWVSLGRPMPAPPPAGYLGSVPSVAAVEERLHLLGQEAPADTAAAFANSYRQVLRSTAWDGAVQSQIARLEERLVQRLTDELRQDGFHEQYGIRQVLSIGSTGRGTYASLPVDFDLMVETGVPQEQIDLARTRNLMLRLAQWIEPLPEFRGHLVLGTGSAKPDEARLVLSSLGLRGKASLVGRLDAVWREGRAERRGTFLDITFGNVSRPVAYHLGMLRTLERLPPPLAERLRNEIRLTKRCMQMLGEVYGSSEIGLRPITIEQMTVQSIRFRASNLPIGTFDNLMLLLGEQGAQRVAEGRWRVVSFEEFKQSFPVWRPGLDSRPEHDEHGRPINLLDLLANGDPVQAQRKWHRVIALAVVYGALRERGQSWTVDSLVRLAQDTCRSGSFQVGGQQYALDDA